MGLVTELVQAIFLILVGAIFFIGGIILVIAVLSMIVDWLRGGSDS